MIRHGAGGPTPSRPWTRAFSTTRNATSPTSWPSRATPRQSSPPPLTKVLDVDPEYVQIISWNDYGESHYIGGVRKSPPFEHKDNFYDYIENMTHDGWRKTLPAWISLWKKGTTTVAKEEVAMWYRRRHHLNTATHIQLEYPTSKVPGAGNVFFDAVLTSPADITVKFNGRTEKSYFTLGPEKGAGVCHGRQYQKGPVQIEMSRNGKVFLSLIGMPIGGCGPSGYRNFNPWVSDMVCTQGWGAGKIDAICRTVCGMGYYPLGACVCTQRGTLDKIPEDKYPMGYTLGDPNYIGLCSFACTKGFCLEGSCSLTEHPIVEPEVSPFLPIVCAEGRANDGGDAAAVSLCEFTCKYGHCMYSGASSQGPIKVCTCTKTGTLKEIQSERDIILDVKGFGNVKVVKNHSGKIAINNMCAFACPYGFCPRQACASHTPDPSFDISVPFCPVKDYDSIEDLCDDLSEIGEHCGTQSVIQMAERLPERIGMRFSEIMKGGYDDL
ncbi:Glucan endo-1,3-alpha-glucosidase agn1 [Neonectria magnoliae]|uniref:Glucan endo-1,3-alpha-glucosidase agn1 n=1 Tax=Neonectria magnoliae TaxID=2732573 RepID=A0ABR1I9Z9_9HYPO